MRLLPILSAPLLIAALLAGCATPPPPAGPLKVQVLAINDLHGNLLPPKGLRLPDPAEPGKTVVMEVGGVEALATAVKQLRKDQPNHIFVAAGDLIGGTPLLSALFRDEPTIESLSSMGLHVSAVGNHEFDLGRDELLRRQRGGCHPVDGCKGPQPFKGAQFQYLSASTVDTATGKTLLPAYLIRRFEDIPVAFIGLTLAGTPGLVMPTGIQGLRFDDEAETVNRLVPELRAQGVESIVVLIHEGGYTTGDVDECPGLTGQIEAIVKKFDRAVDLVVTGHTHWAYNCMINGMRVTSGHKFGSMVTDITLTIDRQTRDVIDSQAKNILTRLDQFAKDPEQTALVAGYLERAKPLIERRVGRLEQEIRQTVNDPAGNWPMGLLLADAHWAATRAPEAGGAEMAFTNKEGVRAGLTPRADGAITYGDLFTVQPFSNELITMTLSGREILEILESQWRSRLGFDPLQPSAGFSYQWDPKAAVGAKVVPGSVRLNGQPLQAERDYRVTVNAFVAAGGDGFTLFARGRNRQTGMLDVQALERYVSAQPLLKAPALDRIKRVD